MADDVDQADALVEFDELMRDGRPSSDFEPTNTQRRRRLLRALIVSVSIVVLLLGGAGGYVAWALNAPLGAGSMTTHEPVAPTTEPADIPLGVDGVTAISVAGADEYLGAEASGVWLGQGVDESRPLASVTKLITALVVLDSHPIDDPAGVGPTLTFDRDDHALYDKYYVLDAAIAAMPTGSSMSLRDALATMLIPSASNYAEAIATWAFGSTGAFARAADGWLAEHGLTQTTVVEPTGFDVRNVSTPRDLIALGKIASAHPVVAQITATREVDFDVTGPLYNTNTLLGRSGVTGLKTGTLDESGANLLYTAQIGVGLDHPLTVVGVTLGGFTRESVAGSTESLLASIQAGFRTLTVVNAGTVAGGIDTAWGSTAELVYDGSGSLLVWSDTPVTVEMSTTTPVTWRDGEVVGAVTWAAGPRSVTVPIAIKGDIVPPDSWWRLTHPGELG